MPFYRFDKVDAYSIKSEGRFLEKDGTDLNFKRIRMIGETVEGHIVELDIDRLGVVEVFDDGDGTIV